MHCNHLNIITMKQILLKVVSRFKKCLVVTTSLLLYNLQLLAAPEDHGRWYSVDDSGSSSHSPAFYVFSFIIGSIAGIIMIVMTLKDNKGSNSDKGCIITFIIGLLVAGFFSMLYLCG